tara:strand:- start:1800 stop:2528 length:729 start_codon:yes stop_codon:yes gene_type:complete
MIYALYRIHYGLDFLEKSINSIIDDVDMIFIYWSKQPWYKGCKDLPPMNENVKEYCKRWNGKVNVIEREFDLPSGQYTQMYADMITGHTIPKKVLMMEPDMVWDKEQLKKALQLTDAEVSFKQIEFWKNEEWYIKRTSGRERPGPTLYNQAPGLTGKGTAVDPNKVNNDIYCYNYGFCLSKEVMKYKFEVAVQSSKYYKDSIPSKDWYEKKWLNWTPETEDLEISEAHKHYIKKALPYGTKD